MTRSGWILFVAMALIWGIPYLFIKIAVTELSPATLVFLRTAIGTVLLFPLAATRRPAATTSSSPEGSAQTIRSTR